MNDPEQPNPYELHTRLTDDERTLLYRLLACAPLPYRPGDSLGPRLDAIVSMTDALKHAFRAYHLQVEFGGRIDCVLATVRASLGALRNLWDEETTAAAAQARLPLCAFDGACPEAPTPNEAIENLLKRGPRA